MRKVRIGAALVMLALLAACGDDGGDAADDPATGTAVTEPAGTDDATTTTAEAATIAVGTTSLGDVVVDSDGRTLYLFTKDSGGKSACTGGCLQNWPPATATGTPSAGEGLDSAKLGTITRDDGTTQVTYGGHPLYRYAADQAAGDTKGQGVGGVWFAVSPAGEAVETGA